MRPRREQVDSTVESTYHCISRVVRRAFLLDDAERAVDAAGVILARKPWIEDRLKALSFIFAIDLDAFAIMDNHLHLVLTLRPQIIAQCSDEEIARRWLRLHPPVEPSGERREATAEDVARLVAEPACIRRLRERLCDIGEYHKALKEPLARLVNREEGTTGHFWNGRFKCRRVLDKEALLAVLVYVELNPIRAQMAETPEASKHTSVWHRARAWKQSRGRRSKRRSRRPDRRKPTTCVSLDAEPTPSFLTPIRATPDRRGLFSHLTLEDYLTLVDKLGRLVRSGKRGRIPRDLPPILERLQFDARGVMAAMASTARLFGSVWGTRASCAEEAARCQRARVVSALQLGSG
jgi:REP element-mobilizing transposase RayT